MQVHIPLLIICVLLCVLPLKKERRKNIILPICFIMITVYMAIRYDYGLDFWSYYYGFLGENQRTFSTEPLYWWFNTLFSKYYQLIAAISVLIMVTIFFLVRKFVPEKFYSLFFLCFLCIPGQSFSIMTALRSDMAFVVLAFGLYKFYIKRKNYALYFLTVIIASLFHNSAAIFIIVPLLDRFILKVNPIVFFCSFIVFSIFSFTGITQSISRVLFSALHFFNGIDSNYYDGYATKYISNFNGAIGRLPLLFPAYYICKYAKNEKDGVFARFYVLSIIYFSIFFLSMDFEYRFTIYLFIYVMIAMSISLEKQNWFNKVVAIFPVVIYSLFLLYGYFYLMQREMYGDYSEGNFFIYETIFENLPLI